MDWNPAVGIPLIIFGVIALVLIYFFGRPKKPGQGQRHPARAATGARVEPTFGGAPASADDAMPDEQTEPFLQGELEHLDVQSAAPAPSSVGARRADRPIERIVTLYVAARAGDTLAGSDIVVAAEKAGLEFGDMGIFHRLVIGKPADGPVFSMANMIRPGSFDMTQLDTVHTPGVTLFMTLPGPLAALDAWEMLLPTAQRVAELLDAQVLDDDRNALGRQRIAHLRDELRAWDRQQERMQIFPGR